MERLVRPAGDLSHFTIRSGELVPDELEWPLTWSVPHVRAWRWL
jgi:hypothetical protein